MTLGMAFLLNVLLGDKGNFLWRPSGLLVKLGRPADIPGVIDGTMVPAVLFPTEDLRELHTCPDQVFAEVPMSGREREISSLF